ncbi:MAG: type IX secretion system PorP/SprF family membrane protein [Flavobacteriales bacterium]|jgi:type IX secretion system PorP/SprF family membrane protein
MTRAQSAYRHLVLVLGILLFSTSIARAQVPGVVSQYMHNGLPLNPAISGSAGYLTGTVSYRTQWSGFEGAPTTSVFSIHAPIKGGNFGLGTVAWIDKFGVSNASSISLMGTYRLRFRKNKLYFGLSGGFQQGQNNWQDVVTNEEGDALFESNKSVYLTPAIGAGIYFVGKRYFVSLSSPVLMDLVYGGGQSYSASFDLGTTPIYLNFGYHFPLSRTVALRPSAMLTKDRYQSIFSDVNLMVEYRGQIQIGASYRTNRSLIGLIRFQVTDQFTIAYSYDYEMSEIGSYSNGSHEVSLQFDLKRNVKALNTRFF